MITDLLGPSLEDLLKDNNKKFNIKTTCLLGKKMIEVVRQLHQNMVIHCDIKPSNFCLEYGQTEINTLNDIKAIDFGLTGIWWNNREKKHI